MRRVAQWIPEFSLQRDLQYDNLPCERMCHDPLSAGKRQDSFNDSHASASLVLSKPQFSPQKAAVINTFLRKHRNTSESVNDFFGI